jgi:hypothetical protein
VRTPVSTLAEIAAAVSPVGWYCTATVCRSY